MIGLTDASILLYLCYGGLLMRSIRIPAQEQYRLIMQCRQSGLTDYQWCLKHNIKPGTFYNWVKRLREKGVFDLPPAAGRSLEITEKQEVVKVDLKKPDIFKHSQRASCADANCNISVTDIPAMKLSIGKCILSIPNGTDPNLLFQTLSVMKEFEC